MGSRALTRRAVFLDRDGVINHNWYNPRTRAWEAPIWPEDFHLRDGVLAALTRLSARGYRLFLVSNQPNATLGKSTMPEISAVHRRLLAELQAGGVAFEAFHYAYAHPRGVEPERFGRLIERKPSPYFLNRAITRLALHRSACWMVGDRNSDIVCGRRARVHTLQIRSEERESRTMHSRAEARAASLAHAVCIILARASAR